MIGAGGHARVLQESLALTGITLHGFTAPGPQSRLVDVEWLGTDERIEAFGADEVLLVNGVGSVGAPTVRARIHEWATARGYRFATVIDAAAVVRPSAVLGAGVQVLAGAVVSTDAVVGANTIVNTGALVDHGSIVGAHCHLAPGSALAGDVTIGEGTHVGLGASVIQGISVGSYSVVGAGAVVVTDVDDRSLAIGVPARVTPLA